MMTAERIPLSSVDRNRADLARAGGDSGPELRSFGRRRTDGGTHPEQPSDPTFLRLGAPVMPRIMRRLMPIKARAR
jgi:hypothetical protein